jgi:putative membrane protein
MKQATLNKDDHLEKQRWFQFFFQLRASVILATLPRVILCGGCGLLVSMLHQLGYNVSFPLESGIVPSIVLGLLLVFRTNTAYDRFWEGRKIWGTLINTVRNLARTIWVSVREERPKDRQGKIETLRLLVAFAVSTKLHLRAEPINNELAVLMPQQWFEKLKQMNTPSLEIAFWIGDYLQQQHQRNCINAYQLTAMFKLLDTMVDCLGASERILKTPIPLAYTIHLKQLLFIYCLSLPFQIIDEFQWGTAPIVALISFTVFGIEEIGVEIENPFGRDPNDLPLDQICNTMNINIEDLITLTPCLRQWETLSNELI